MTDNGFSLHACIIHWLLLLYRLVRKNVCHLYWCIQSKTQVPPPQDDILKYSATRLAEDIRSGKMTATAVTSAFVARAHFVNPIVNALVSDRFGDALREARDVDITLVAMDKQQRGQLTISRPLYGVPFTCSANSGNDDQMALSIKRMNMAGAILLGWTNSPDDAASWETVSESYGATRNVRDTRRVAGGAGGGGAVAVAAQIAPLSIAHGNCRTAAAFSGVFAFHSSRNDPGYSVLATSTEDLQLVAQVLSDVSTESTSNEKNAIVSKHAIFYAVAEIPFLPEASLSQEAAVSEVIKHLEALYSSGSSCMQLAYPQRALDILLRRKSKGFFRKEYGKGDDTDNEELKLLLSGVTRSMNAALGAHGVLILPAAPCPAPFHGQLLRTPLESALAELEGLPGLPAITLPVGTDAHGMSLACQLVSAAHTEHHLFQVAKELERQQGTFAVSNHP